MTQREPIDRLSLQEIWTRGCMNQPLHPEDKAHFMKLAKSRFHTFLLGMQHTEKSSQPDAAAKADLLIRGMVTELIQNPGLKVAWHEYNFQNSTVGLQVTQHLRPAVPWWQRTLRAISGRN